MSSAQGPGRDDLTDDPEVPEEDALEQRAEVAGDPDADRSDEPDEPGDDAVEAVELGEADPADVAEQARTVGTDEDDYR
jgi:hypothetical protein